MSQESRDATRHLSDAEVYCRWPNWSGKTTMAAAAVVAMLQGRKALDGVPLPRFKKAAAAVLSLDYNQQKFSVQPAYLAALGDWPHKLTYKGDGILSTLRVMPIGGAEESRWPMATFLSQENPNTGTGARMPIVHADEPPNERIWQELRKSKVHGERYPVRIITATPLIRRQWWWLKRDYEGCQGVIHGRRIEVHMADVRNSRLVDAARYQELLDEYRGDPLILARLTAAYIDVSGASPWGDLFDVLDEMLEHAKEPEPRTVEVTRELDGEGGRCKVVEKVEVEVWVNPKAGEAYYLDIDPSLGINDERHDPGGLHVSNRRTGDLCLRYSGYIGAYGLGVLAAGLARQYNGALVDPETTGGYGGPCLTALDEMQYRNIAQGKAITTPDGKIIPRLGFATSIETRPTMFSSIQEWLKAWKAGLRYAKCPSRAILQCLKDLVLDESGKPLAAPGLHDEDAILWGQKLRTCKPSAGRLPLTQARKPLVVPTLTFNLGAKPNERRPVGTWSRPSGR